MERYQGATDENELARAISTTDPAASREEILFRYKLSKNVYLKGFELPMLPGSAVQVMRLGQDPNASASDYLDVIQSDPSLASAIVKTSNSALFARSLLLSHGEAKATTLDDAIVRLGVNEIEKLAMLHSFNAKVFRVSGHGELVDEVIRHGLSVSFAAQAVADESGSSPTEAFIAGLFHDVGKLILLQTIADVQQKLRWVAPAELVKASFDAFHTVVGGLVCDGWELPNVVADAVRHHHNPEKAAGAPISQAVYLGNRIAHAINETPSASEVRLDASSGETGPDSEEYWRGDVPVIEASGISKERVATLSDEISSQLAALNTPRSK